MKEQPSRSGSVQELVYVLKSSDARTQAYLLIELSNYLPQDIKRETLQRAIAATNAIQHGSDRLDALKRLAPRLLPHLLPQVLSMGKAMPSEIDRTRALQVLAPMLPRNLLLEALSIAREQDSEYCRSIALSALIDWLPKMLKTEVSLEALAAARSIQSRESSSCTYYVRALGAVASSLSSELHAEVLQEALKVARAMDDRNGCRATALANLAPKLPKALRQDVLQEALHTVTAEGKRCANAEALSVLVPELPAHLLPAALNLAMNIQPGGDRALALIALAIKLPELIPEAFAAVKSTRSECTRALSLKTLAPKLPPELLLEAVSITNSFRSERDRITTLIALGSPLSKMPRRKLFPLWQTILRSLSSHPQQDFAHSVLALSAIVHALGGQKAVVETIVSIAGGRVRVLGDY